MLVRERMSTPPITIRIDADYKIAVDLMREHAVHHVPVLDAGGVLRGIVAERDLLVAATRFLQSSVEVGEVMHRDVVTVTPETRLEHAAALMSMHKIGGLPVVGEAGTIVGMITETDMLVAFVEALAQAREPRAESMKAAARKPRVRTRPTARKTSRARRTPPR
ncbi:MAG TPA: CBS domain-containing protein [Burkholderiales bacterium]